MIKESEEQDAIVTGVKSAATAAAERAAAASTAKIASVIAKQAATMAAKVAAPTAVKPPPWTCYHPSNPLSKATGNANLFTATARATAQDKRKRTERDHITNIGEHYQEQFKRIAKENGVSDEKLHELDNIHNLQGAQDQLLLALQTLMVGDDLECISVAEELSNQVGLDTALFEEMTVHPTTLSTLSLYV